MKKIFILFLGAFILNSCDNNGKTTEPVGQTKSNESSIDANSAKETNGGKHEAQTNEKNPLSKPNEIKPAKTFVLDKNVYVAFDDGTKKQLTFNQSDSDPILLPGDKQVLYIRNQAKFNHKVKIIMTVNIIDLKESTLSDQKPYRDGNDDTNDILRISNPVLSIDGQNILFVTEKYVTGNQLVEVNVQTGVWKELFTAESFEQIAKGTYKGYFLVGQIVIEDRGRDVYYRLVNQSGEIIKKFSNKESMNEFRNSL